ncbi:Crp/Fnr family transcriptional regulator [Cryomorpha ignava]|uniref:Crp/Fnr family transcriptional regulator n=1 Tax=Cryomorpha ignava TaxID=101383 RepID=A0A7K3WVL2_9FLAO|nr:Crp/Fnr family transcriptional regulator [Cryomorpha ignava]NEN24962.1 Crp/Fnr family transcriptional regulator [Cryomorpha ignava]
MTKSIFEKIYNHLALRKEDLDSIANAHEQIDFQKGHVFLENGKVANEYYLIQSGLVRSWLYDYNGDEITTEFYGDGEILIEVSSLFQRIPTKENIVALTAGTALRIDFDKFQELYHKIPAFNEWGRAWMSNQLFMSKQRTIDMLTRSAADRYLAILKHKPLIIKEAPLKHIASYLGITNSSLSRIRKEIFSA